MATHDYIVDNQNGANFRSDLNNALAAIVSNNSSATAPTTTYAFMLWADTASDLLKQRNAADSAWINILTLSTGAPLGALAASLVSGTHTNFTSTGIDDNATSTAITIDSAEHVSLAHGIGFNGDTAAANALDDYETGDFTITLSSGATTTPTYAGCRYTKIGNIVHVDVYIGFAGITQNATAIQVTGLPFAPVNRILVPANCYQRVNFDSAKNQFWYIEAASTTLNLQEATTNTNSVSTVPSQSGSFSPVFDAISFSYHTA